MVDSIYRADKLWKLGIYSLQSCRPQVARRCFERLVEQDKRDWHAWFMLSLMQFFRQEDAEGTASLKRAWTLAPGKSVFISFAKERCCEYLGFIASQYAQIKAYGSVREIISPHGMDVIGFLRIVRVQQERYSITLGEDFTKSLDRLINALTMCLFQRAEFSGIRLRLPIELLSKGDIQDADALFCWLDELCGEVIAVSPRCGARFFELQTGFRLEIARQCMPRLADVLKAYTYAYPFQKDRVLEEAELARTYAVMLLTICHSVAPCDDALKRIFVDSVPLLQNLRVERVGLGGDNRVAGEIVYGITQKQYQGFLQQARFFARELSEKDESYLPPPEIMKQAKLPAATTACRKKKCAAQIDQMDR